MAVSLPQIRRGGTYYRVCGPDWVDPAETSYSKLSGGRWNAPGAFGMLYLNANLEGARANARRFIANQFGPNVLPEDINPDFLPDAAAFTIAVTNFVDAVTAASRTELHLAPSYRSGSGWDRCRKVGAAAHASACAGVATTSAVTEQSEELAIFDRAVRAITRAGRRQRFADWWTPTR